MGRHKQMKNSMTVSVRFEADEYRHICELAAFQQSLHGRAISAQELIRDATSYVLRDGEKMREIFRRIRNKMIIMGQTNKQRKMLKKKKV